MTRVLCLGAHNDEIMADIGGTVALLVDAGCKVRALGLACQWNDDTLDDATKDEYRRQEFAAAKELGCEFKVVGNRDDMVFLESKAIIEELVREILDFMPDIVFIHPPRDNHIEHRESAHASLKALEVAHVRGAKIREVYAFDTGICQSLDYFRPDFGIDITDKFDRVKASILHFNQNHANGRNMIKNNEIRKRYRGREFGLELAEVYKIVKFPNGSDDFLLKQLLGKRFRWYGNAMYPAFGEYYF